MREPSVCVHSSTWCVVTHFYSSTSAQPSSSSSPITPSVSSSAMMLFVCFCIRFVHDGVWLQASCCDHTHTWLILSAETEPRWLLDLNCLAYVKTLLSVLLLSLSALSLCCFSSPQVCMSSSVPQLFFSVQFISSCETNHSLLQHSFSRPENVPCSCKV